MSEIAIKIEAATKLCPLGNDKSWTTIRWAFVVGRARAKNNLEIQGMAADPSQIQIKYSASRFLLTLFKTKNIEITTKKETVREASDVKSVAMIFKYSFLSPIKKSTKVESRNS